MAAALTSYQTSLAVAEWLAKADPENTGQQQDLSKLEDKIGQVREVQGDLAAALTSYQSSLASKYPPAKPGALNSCRNEA